MLQGVTLYNNVFIQIPFRNDGTYLEAHKKPIEQPWRRLRYTLIRQGVPTKDVTPYTLSSLEYIDIIQKIRNDIKYLEGLAMHALDRALMIEALDYIEGALHNDIR